MASFKLAIQASQKNYRVILSFELYMILGAYLQESFSEAQTVQKTACVMVSLITIFWVF